MIDVTVTFSDELLLDTSSGNVLPTLPLNNGGEAELVGGTGSREWLFSYTFPEDAAAAAASAVAVLDIADVPVTIDCTGGCRAENWNGEAADLSVRKPTRFVLFRRTAMMNRGAKRPNPDCSWLKFFLVRHLLSPRRPGDVVRGGVALEI